MEWPRIFSLIAHELRSPAAVISGYARLIRDGRLPDADRAEALVQIERAAGRLTHLAREASDLARWLSPDDEAPAVACGLEGLMDQAVSRAAAVERVRVETSLPSDPPATVRLHDPVAVTAAVGSIIDAVAREALDGPVDVRIGLGAPPLTFDILVGPSALWQVSDKAAPPDPKAMNAMNAMNPMNPMSPMSPMNIDEPVPLDRGGLGLALVLAVAILERHHVRTWAFGPERRGVGVRFGAAS